MSAITWEKILETAREWNFVDFGVRCGPSFDGIVEVGENIYTYAKPCFCRAHDGVDRCRLSGFVWATCLENVRRVIYFRSSKVIASGMTPPAVLNPYDAGWSYAEMAENGKGDSSRRVLPVTWRDGKCLMSFDRGHSFVEFDDLGAIDENGRKFDGCRISVEALSFFHEDERSSAPYVIVYDMRNDEWGDFTCDR